MSKYQLKTYIVKFEDGTYFNGVKGKRVRKTKHFKDAKRIDSGKLNDRDLSYLKNKKYSIIKVKYTIEENIKEDKEKELGITD